MTLQPGDQLGPYEILSLVGSGGMGEVYKAVDSRLERTVAVKVLPHAHTRDSHAQQRLTREARLVAALSHPHICRLFDVGQHDGADFLVMEFLEGETLARRLQRGRLPLEQALRYGIEMAGALAAAHAAGIVHRDLKPSNVILTRSGAKLLDFGVAKPRSALSIVEADGTTEQPLTQDGTITGTLQYMAPEQLEGHEADARSDIFAFGAVLFETVTGKKAFEARSTATLIAQDHPVGTDALGDGRRLGASGARVPDSNLPRQGAGRPLAIRSGHRARSAASRGRAIDKRPHRRRTGSRPESGRYALAGTLLTLLVVGIALLLLADAGRNDRCRGRASTSLCPRPWIRLARLAGGVARRATARLLRALRRAARAVGAIGRWRRRTACRYGRRGLRVLVSRQPDAWRSSRAGN